MFGAPGEYVLFADGELTPEDYAAAKKLLGRLNDSVRAGGPAIQSLKHTAADGTTYVATVGLGTKRVFVRRAPFAPGEPEVTLTALWIPRGFVFIPGDTSGPQGYGLPVKMDSSSSDPFNPVNADPGMDPARWTAGGPCGQVHLTAIDTDKYPPRDRQLIPIAFEPSQWSPGDSDTVPVTAWHAVRARFNDFKWDPSSVGARQAYWKAVIAAAATGFRLPFATHYDDAQRLAQLLDKYGAMAALPDWFATVTQRANKDGIPLAYGEGYGSGQPDPAQVAAQLGTPTSGGWPALDLGLGAPSLGISNAYQGGWIETGNVYWHPADLSLPTLSWLGHPAMNLPGWITTAAFAPIENNVLPELESVTYEWRQTKATPLYGKNLYAMGRCIGTLPETVIAAGIAKVQHLDQTGANKTYDQLRVITWNSSDQPINSTVYNYLWQFNLWFVESTPIPGVPLHLDDLPVGAYDAVTNPSGWHKAGSFVLEPGADPLDDLLRLVGQFWRFDPTGNKALAYMQYTTTQNGSQYSTPLEVTFDNVSDGTMGTLVNRPTVPAMSDPYFSQIIAIDYAANGTLACVYQCNYPTSPTLPLPPGAQSGYPPNAPGSLQGISAKWFWSGGGDADGEVAGWYGGSGAANTCPIVQLWALDARDGVTAMVNHWFDTPPADGDPMPETYYVRLCRNGNRLVTDTFLDTVGIDDFDSGYLVMLDRFKACYAHDRDGNWVFGYDFGVTSGQTYVYSSPVYPNTYGTPQWPSAVLATTSSWTKSHWLSNVGDPVALAKTDPVSTQLFPVGVC